MASNPPVARRAKTCDLVFESGKPFLVISFEDGEWQRIAINNDQLWHLFDRLAPQLRGR